MKITWDNIDSFRITKFGNFTNGNNAFYIIEGDGCCVCGDPYFIQRDTYKKGKGRFCSHSCCMINVNHQDHNKGVNHHSWSGGTKKSKLTSYDTYINSLLPYGVKCRRSEKDHHVLEVRCHFCKEWFAPLQSPVRSKIASINGDNAGENNLYCSNLCKYLCPTYRRSRYHKDDPGIIDNNTTRSQLKQIIFKRDGYVCQRCGGVKNLNCHHIDPTKNNPIESADIDNCITLCYSCHIKAHKSLECSTSYLRKC